MMASLKPSQLEKLIKGLSDKECEALIYDWQFWARPEQLQPKIAFTVWMLISGRGYGKTRTGSEFVLERIRSGVAKYIGLIGRSKADVRDIMIEIGESSLLKCSPPWFMPKYQPSKRRIVWPNGAVAMVYSGDEPDQLRGPQHDTVWVDELAKFQYPEETWDNIEMGLRLGKDPKAIITTTPRPIPLIKKLVADPDTVVTRGTTDENIGNLSEKFMERIYKKYAGTRLGRQELSGEILEDRQGALWKQALIEQYRVRVAPTLNRVVVAIDPEATSTEDSSETGIVIAGEGSNGHFYVMRDASLRATPNVWAAEAVNAYHDLEADRIIGEVNNGGEMIEAVIRNLDANVSYTAVRATRGKITRAEPISALYEQGRVHHVGCFPELEDQMANYTPGEKSPDRMDALVWALTFLTENGDDLSYVMGRR